MSAKIFDFKKEKEARLPPVKIGMLQCLQCHHEWAGEVPFGVNWFECPRCESMKAAPKFFHVREGLHWMCQCGNTLFLYAPPDFYCPQCGETQRGALPPVS